MNKRQHVGDDLDQRRSPDGPHMEKRIPHRVKRRTMQLQQALWSSRKERQFAPRSKMDSAGDRQFKKPDFCRLGHGSKPQGVVATDSRHLNQTRTLPHIVQNLGQYCARNLGRRQAGDHMID